MRLILEDFEIQADEGTTLTLKAPVRFTVKDGMLVNLDPLEFEAQDPFLLIYKDVETPAPVSP